jgi:hypothetical protein
MKTILLVGEDRHILASRAWLMEKIGGKLTCCQAAEFPGCLQQQCFDLIVLCHTLDASSKTSITEEIRRLCPESRILLVIRENHPASAEGFDIDAYTGALHPAKLMQTAIALLAMPAPPPHHPRSPSSPR